MSQLNFEQMMNAVRTLSPEQLAQLREIVNEPNGKPHKETMRPIVREHALSRERQWLAEHCDEYVGQWVALKGDQLISHGPRRSEVEAAAVAAGHPDALIAPVERVRYVGPLPLSPEEVTRLREIYRESHDPKQQATAAHALCRAATARGFSDEHDWLAEHRDEYVGQWVALTGKQLLSHGPRLKEVHETALAAGYPDALLERIEPLDAPDILWK